MSNKDKKLRNKVEFICISFYSIGLILFLITACPIFILITILSVPFCNWKPIREYLTKE